MKKEQLIKKSQPKKETIVKTKKKPPVPARTVWDAKQKAQAIAQAVFDKKGEDIALLHVEAFSMLADYYLICSASSEPHIWAIVDAVETVLQKNKYKVLGIEGAKNAPWVLVDCSNVIVNIFKQDARAFYNLDELWADAPRIDLSEEALVASPKPRKRKAT